MSAQTHILLGEVVAERDRLAREVERLRAVVRDARDDITVLGQTYPHKERRLEAAKAIQRIEDVLRSGEALRAAAPNEEAT